MAQAASRGKSMSRPRKAIAKPMDIATEARVLSLSQGQVTIVDGTDYEWLSQWKWYARFNECTRSYYAVRNSATLNGKRDTVYLHRELLGLKAFERLRGDHVNRNTLDNRRSNLRRATAAENSRNRCTRKTSYAKLKGVSRDRSRYRARVTVNRKSIYLGGAATAEEAYKLVLSAIDSHHGEFVPLNMKASRSNGHASQGVLQL
jgi:hypothetical protein